MEPLAKLTKKEREMTQQNSDMKEETLEQMPQKWKCSYNTIMNNYTQPNWIKKDKFLERYNLQKLNLEEIQNVNRLITSTDWINIQKPANKEKPRTS